MKEQVEGFDTKLRQYLLGELPDSEQQKIEEQLLLDSDYLEQMLSAEDDIIDDYLKGGLPPPQKHAYEKLFLATREGQQKLKVTQVLKKYLAEFKEPQPSLWSRFQTAMAPFFSPMVLKTAAALLVIGLGVLNWSLFFRQSDLKKSIASLSEAYREERPIQARITGLPYAPFPGAHNSHNQANAVKLSAADKAFHNLAEKSRTSANLHALGKYFLTERNFDEAIKHLEEALKTAPSDPAIHVDLAVAFMEKGKTALASAPSDQAQANFDNSQNHLLQALNLDPPAPVSLEARFNLGLLHQTRKLWKEAEEDWQQYLKADTNSQWAAEAKRYLSAAIEAQKK